MNRQVDPLEWLQRICKFAPQLVAFAARDEIEEARRIDRETKFIIKMKGSYFRWNREDPSKNEWVKDPKKATPVSLTEANGFLDSWKKYKAEAVLLPRKDRA